jgi:hypothetical protein
MHLTTGRGRQEFRFLAYHANKKILGIRPNKILVHPMNRSSAPDVDDDGDNDSLESFVGTDDGFEDRTHEACYVEDHTPESCYANAMHARKPNIGVRIVNATILRVEPRPSSFSQGLKRLS